ncbi:hypothetical protein MHBO_004924 [Bonamia ostreae]|uniref:Uncharacterized protein n=1 Tax=Bonamia ostreae TaxID=126728 RepID=A0ABV2AUL5_9EUKA
MQRETKPIIVYDWQLDNNGEAVLFDDGFEIIQVSDDVPAYTETIATVSHNSTCFQVIDKCPKPARVDTNTDQALSDALSAAVADIGL